MYPRTRPVLAHQLNTFAGPLNLPIPIPYVFSSASFLYIYPAIPLKTCSEISCIVIKWRSYPASTSISSYCLLARKFENGIPVSKHMSLRTNLSKNDGWSARSRSNAMNDACMSRHACRSSGLRDGLKWYNVSRARSHICPSAALAALLSSAPTACASSGSQPAGLAASAAYIWTSGVDAAAAAAAAFRTLSWANSACGGAIVIPTYDLING